LAFPLANAKRTNNLQHFTIVKNSDFPATKSSPSPAHPPIHRKLRNRGLRLWPAHSTQAECLPVVLVCIPSWKKGNSSERLWYPVQLRFVFPRWKPSIRQLVEKALVWPTDRWCLQCFFHRPAVGRAGSSQKKKPDLKS
jgi:hypothetical protein